MKSLRALSVLVLAASCFDAPGVHIVGTFPIAPTGGAEQQSGGGSTTGGGGGTGVSGGGTGFNIGGGTATPAPCDCTIANSELTMSWDCYCAKFGCTRGPAASCGDYIESSTACGLRVVELSGPRVTTVFDSTGAAVGGKSYSDLLDYVCPDNATLHAGIARGGNFPDASCSPTACDCVDGGIVCP